MTTIDTNDFDHVWQILHEDQFSRLESVVSNNTRFVHYTSAENGLSIVDGKQVWLRNTQAMNDYMELEHGLSLLQEALHTETGTHRRKWDSLNSISPTLAENVRSQFEVLLPAVRNNTYVFCLSEHLNDEDVFGRLSMWRAYGKNPAGVAIVLKNSPFVAPTDTSEIGVFSVPIDYMSNSDFGRALELTFDRLEENASDLSQYADGELSKTIAFALLQRAIACKHPGFHEEREWRLVILDKLYSNVIAEKSIEKISGIPQIVYKLPISNYDEYGISGSTLRELVDRIIIGPSDQAFLIRDAFVERLSEVGVSQPSSRVIVSEIPLR